jgi:hypothetical protein
VVDKKEREAVKVIKRRRVREVKVIREIRSREEQ